MNLQNELRHDIKNHLSTINLALEQLKYELPNISEDCVFYLETISDSVNHINSLLTELKGKQNNV